jgi:MFS family permease
MSAEAASEHTPAQDGPPRSAGVLATWRQTHRQAKALLAGVFVSRLAGFLQIFLVLFLTHQGFSPARAGLALGLYGAGAVAGTFAGGWLSDRLSVRTVTLISMMGSAVLIISILYLSVYPLILLAVLLVSTVGRLFQPAAQTLITELTPPGQLVMVTAMYRLSLNLGTSLTPLIGAALVSISYDLLFWAEALAAFTYGLIALKALPPRRGPAGPTAGTAPRRRSGYLALLADRRYLLFLAAVLLVSAVYCQYTAALPLAIVGAGLSLWWYSAIVSLNAVVIATCEVVATRFVQAWPLRLTVLAGFGLVAAGYATYAVALVPATLILGTLIWTLSEMIGAPTVFAYPGLVAPVPLRGRYFGAMQSVFGLGAATGPVLGVALWDHLGPGVWLWAAAVAVIAAACAQAGMRQPRPGDPEPTVKSAA